jgi:hypothetical protein
LAGKIPRWWHARSRQAATSTRRIVERRTGAGTGTGTGTNLTRNAQDEIHTFRY